jgi:membrane associated rhomboid family serine protease
MFFPLHDQNNDEVKSVPIVSYVIIGLCFIVHLYQIILGIGQKPPIDQTQFLYKHGWVPRTFFSGATNYQVFLHGTPEIPAEQLEALKEFPPESDQGKFLRLVEVNSSPLWIYLMPLTYMFMHGGWMHFLSNIWFFWIFSDNVEEKMGHFKFLIFYLLTGIFSGFGHALINSASRVPLIGASGAISAVMGAYVGLFPGNRITSYFCPIWFFIRRIDVPAYVVLGMYLLINFLSMTSFQHSNTAFDAHIFGFLAGFGVAFAMVKIGKKA